MQRFKALSVQVRHIHTSKSNLYPRRPPPLSYAPPQLQRTGILHDSDKLADVYAGVEELQDSIQAAEEDDELHTGAHLLLRQRRQALYYIRLIDHDMPNLARFRKPFVPPKDKETFAIRTMLYGEENPASEKCSIVVPVAHLPLNSPAAKHAAKLLAGARWTQEPPANSGMSEAEANYVEVEAESEEVIAGRAVLGKEHRHGFIQISCEDFPEGAMNLQWCCDALDRLIAEANRTKDRFKHLPVDTRHIDSRVQKARRGERHSGRLGPRPTLRDFPPEWLPSAPLEVRQAVN